jgi:ubiquitin-protein ligase
MDSVILSVQLLLASPEPRDPQDAMVAKQFMNNISLFNVLTYIYDHNKLENKF